VTHTEINSSSQHEVARLAEIDYNLLMKGYKPQLIQTSPMYNTVSKIRGCQFMNLTDRNNSPFQFIFTSDSLGGLFASVTNKSTSDQINQVGKPVTTDLSA
jgi:hypothetical protein